MKNSINLFRQLSHFYLYYLILFHRNILQYWTKSISIILLISVWEIFRRNIIYKIWWFIINIGKYYYKYASRIWICWIHYVHIYTISSNKKYTVSLEYTNFKKIKFNWSVKWNDKTILIVYTLIQMIKTENIK